jgi:hypothetical protein
LPAKENQPKADLRVGLRLQAITRSHISEVESSTGAGLHGIRYLRPS